MTDETMRPEGPATEPMPEANPSAPEERGGGGMGRAIIWLIILVILAAGGYKWYQSRKATEPAPEQGGAQTAPASSTESTAPETGGQE